MRFFFIYFFFKKIRLQPFLKFNIAFIFFFAVHVNIAGEPYTLALFDTAGQEDYDRLRPLSYPQTDVFLLCFSVVNPASSTNVVEKWMPELNHYSPHTPVILVGTQEDLRDDPNELHRLSRNRQKPVSAEDGQKLAKKIRAATYVECSALTQRGLKNVFDEAILAAIDPPSKRVSKKKQCLVL